MTSDLHREAREYADAAASDPTNICELYGCRGVDYIRDLLAEVERTQHGWDSVSDLHDQAVEAREKAIRERDEAWRVAAEQTRLERDRAEKAESECDKAERERDELLKWKQLHSGDVASLYAENEELKEIVSELEAQIANG